MNGELVKLREKHGFVDNKNLLMITYPGFERLWIPPEIEEPEVFSKHFFCSLTSNFKIYLFNRKL